MGTRSRIGIENEGGTVRSIYCHWDGYPENNGEILLKHYTDVEKINALLDEGDMSSLGREIGSKHSFDSKPEGECNFYRRDRGETDVDAIVSENVQEYLNLESDQEYSYLFKDGEWFYSPKYGNHAGQIVPLKNWKNH